MYIMSPIRNQLLQQLSQYETTITLNPLFSPKDFHSNNPSQFPLHCFLDSPVAFAIAFLLQDAIPLLFPNMSFLSVK